MKQFIDIETWNRKEYFKWFDSYKEPFWSILADVECSGCYQNAKSCSSPFSLNVLYFILKAVNSIDELKFRKDNEKIVKFDTIHASPTVARADKSFAFSFFEYHENIDEFIKNALRVTDDVQKTSGLNVKNDVEKRIDTIHYSTIPWVKFTGLTHARNLNGEDSCPKISTGKFYVNNFGKLMLPVSLTLHHGFADGYHAGLLFEKIENLMK